MVLQKLQIINFRSFANLSLELPNSLLIFGENSLGKSTILESIYFLATTKSPRAFKDSQLIKLGEFFVSVTGEVNGDEKVGLEIIMQKKNDPEPGLSFNGLEKRVRVNGVAKRVTDYIGNLVAVLFSPEDINLVTGSPALRRWHLDLTLAQIDREYKMALTTYSEALSSRNRILKRLKEGKGGVNELEFWNDQMVVNGDVISRKRAELFQFLNQQGYLDVFGKLEFAYQPSLISQSKLSEYYTKELAAQASLIGPHREDFTFILNGKNLSYFGSRGQQRTAVLNLKLSELKFIQQLKKTPPVLLLDDVFSELDKDHRDYVISVIGGQQTIISAVEKDNIPSNFLDSIQVLAIDKL